MIGGAPYFMVPLEKMIISIGLQPLYAFSERRSKDILQEDGTVVKSTVFEHVGFVKPFLK